MVDGNVGGDTRGRTRLADEKGQRAGCTAKSIVKATASEAAVGLAREAHCQRAGRASSTSEVRDFRALKSAIAYALNF
jgi:hypothetical protein